jgi:putative transposase
MTRKPYPTDLTAEQWELLESILPPPELRGRKRTVELWEVFNALSYLLRSGCQWRLLPHDFPAWQTVYYYFRKWRDAEWFVNWNDDLRIETRLAAGRDPEPSAASIDSQSVKTTELADSRGYDAGKKINGRKRHALVETQGLPLRFKVLPGNVQDRDGAKILLDEVKDQFPRLRLIWADGGYRGKLVEWVATTCAWLLQIVLRKDGVKGFHLLPRRWVVERTFAWLYRNRRLCKDYERQAASEEAFCYFATTLLMLRRLRPTKAAS